METSGELFKKKLDKAFTDPSIKLNATTMGDAIKYKQSFKEEKIEGGVADGKTLMSIVKKHAKGDSVDPSTKRKIKDIFRKIKIQLNKGIKVEMEHTNSRVKAREIAMDHLWEDPKYYDKLSKVETKEEKEKKYLDIEDMIPMLRKQLNKGTRFDKDSKEPKDKKETKESNKISAKKQFSKDLQSDKDFVDFKERANKKDFTYGIPNVTVSDPFIQKKKFSRPGKEESKEATGSGSSGAYSGPLFGGEMKEKWSEKYKKSIDCDNPKGFSQKAHCQSKKKKIETKEATSTGSTGSFSAPVGFKDSEFVRRSFKETPKLKESDVEKVEATEATTSGSVGGYETPAMWAKSTKKKDWGPSRKTQIPGGGFVKVKKKCTKFPYCNQGDINNLKISKNESVMNAIKNVAKRTGLSENTIITILEHEYEKIGKRTK